MPRVLLIEDEEGLGEALEYQLRRAGYDVDRATDGTRGVDAFESTRPDLVLLDLMLPGMPGEEVCRHIRRKSPVPIIMLTARDTETDKVVGLELGADDYMTKPFSTRELLARVKAVLRRASQIPFDGVLEAGNVRVDVARHEVTVAGVPVHLPRKEFHILTMLMSRPGAVCTREQLLDEVWGGDYFGDTRTLDVHVKRLRDRLSGSGETAARIQTIRGVGFKLAG